MNELPMLVITSIPNSGAALLIDEMARRGLRPSGVILDMGKADSRSSYLQARLKKIRKRGVLGPLLSRRLIGSATSQPSLDGLSLFRDLGIDVSSVDSINHPDALAALQRSDAVQAFSLGNRYIRPYILEGFGRPIFNLHHGKVPEYRGGPPIFWEIYDDIEEVGFTVHKVDRGIDTGGVMLQGAVPLQYRNSLRQTMTDTWVSLLPTSVRALADAVEKGFPLAGEPRPQATRGVLRTSPGVRHILKAARNVRARRAS